MNTRRLVNIAMVVTILLIATGLFVSYVQVGLLPKQVSQHETIVLGQNRMVPGSQAALRVLVRDSRDGSGLADAEVKIGIQPVAGGALLNLYTGKTDKSGTANISFAVPKEADLDQILVVQTNSSLGSDRLEQQVSLARDYRILLTTDKPIYQPGQMIHLRALALSTFDMVPAGERELLIVIADGKGNKVFRKTVRTSEYGVAATDFQLASEVNSGNYKISAVMDNTTSEKTVTVEPYVLPKYAVKMDLEKDYYTPGERVKGSLQVDYFFGKPVSQGRILLEGFTYDVERTVVVNLQGATDAQGHFEFEFDLPEYIAGTDLEQGLGRFYLQAMVTDQAEHTEVSNTSIAVASKSLVVEAIPEGGVFRQGVDNILYVMTSYPDGRPADTKLVVTFPNENKTLEASTGEFGITEVHITPSTVWQKTTIAASDRNGNQTVQDFYFEGQYSSESVLLRLEKPVYVIGDTMNLMVLTSARQGTVYVDIVREGQTISTRSLESKNGVALAAVDISPDMFGTLEIHAYKLLQGGEIARDTRLVVVNRPDDLLVDIKPGQEIYKPGDDGVLNIHVQGGANLTGVQSAVGLAIVDESVFALAQQDPGFAKLYFLLEQQILTPRYDLHGLGVPELMTGVPSNNPKFNEALNESAQASLSAANPVMGVAFSLQANSYDEAMSRVYQQQTKGYQTIFLIGLAGFVIIPVVLAILMSVILVRARLLGRSILLGVGLLVGLFVLFSLIGLIASGYTPYSFFDPLGQFLNILFSGAEGGVGIWGLLLLAVIAFIALVVTCIRRKEASLGWGLFLIVVQAVFVIVIALSGSRGVNTSSDEWLAVVAIGAFLLMPVVLLVRSAGYFWQKRFVSGLSMLMLVFFVLFGSFGLLAVGGVSGNMAAAPGVRMDKEMGLVEQAVPMMAAATQVASVDDMAAKGGGESTTTAQPPRLRQYFPETMLWLPDAITDADGRLQVNFPIADSITTWRVSALVSSRDGRLGEMDVPMRVFQDYFIDLDLPQSLTVGDEVAVPVGVFNYLAEPQTVKLELEQAAWFELVGPGVQEMSIAANDISVVYFRIKATAFGAQPFKVTAYGSKMSDAILKNVRVYPNGKPIDLSSSGRIMVDEAIIEKVYIPADAIAGTQKLMVKIYPGVLSQVVEGLDSILRMPNGCFEQTSSSTYPNVLVLDYLKMSGQSSPETEMKAEEYINLGYQRLLTFEVVGGGFSLFGDVPADRMLTAYGLQEFADMSRVFPVDDDVLKRSANWLFSQQENDGSWQNDRGLVHESTWSALGNDRLPVTAYIAWSLVDAGFSDQAGTQKALDYVRENQNQATDAYVLALVTNALVSADLKSGSGMDSSTLALLERLAGMAKQSGGGAEWSSGVATFTGSEGVTGSIETTALAALAFLRSDTHPEMANAALTAILKSKDSYGTWYSTQATVLSLKALIESMRAGAEDVDADITITLNDGQTRKVSVDKANFDVVQLVQFDDINLGRENVVQVKASGKGNLMYQVVGSYYLPWDTLAKYPDVAPAQDAVTIQVGYDRTQLAVNDTVQVSVSVALNVGGSQVDAVLIDLGLPPGFSVEAEDLRVLVDKYNEMPTDYPGARIERFELTGRQIIIYITHLKNGEPMQFNYRLRARFPLAVQTPASNAYDYYNPEVSGETPPQLLVVTP
jgi:MFS family permease